jgi:hypothetical protein
VRRATRARLGTAIAVSVTLFATLGMGEAARADEVLPVERSAATTTGGVEHQAMPAAVNRPPSTPTTRSMRTKASATGAELACVTVASNATPLRVQRPYLQAQGSDPDGSDPRNQTVSLKFIVVDNATNVARWESGWTSTAASGSTHRVRVGTALSSQRTYRWRVKARDSAGKVTGWSADACMIRPDTTAPNEPIVSSTLYQEYPAGLFGGIGQPGTFTFHPNGSSDVASYHYSFNDGQVSGTKNASSTGWAEVTFTPLSPGPNVVEVVSKDIAGIASPEVRYEFWVGYPALDGRWRLDEGTGLTAQNDITAGETAGNLALSSAGLWQNTDGTPAYGAMHDLLAGDPGLTGDRALVFDSDTDVVRSAGPAVAIDESYTVTAFLKVSAGVTASGAAVSQEGQHGSAFHLGYSTSPECETDGEPCWAYWVNDADSTDAGQSTLRSDVAVVPGQWMNVAAQYDATAGTLSIRVCDPAFPLDAPDPDIVSVTPVSWTATGPLRLGSGMRAGAVEFPFRGVIDDVRVYREALFGDTERMARICSGAPVP